MNNKDEDGFETIYTVTPDAIAAWIEANPSLVKIMEAGQ